MLVQPKYQGYQDVNPTEIICKDIEDMLPYEIKLPEPPQPEEIVNFGLAPEKQYFVKSIKPDKVARIDRITASTTKKKKELVDKAIKALPKEDKKWIEREWFRRLNGQWQYINGKPTFIPPTHYFYVNYHHIDVGLPNYYDYDRRELLLWDLVIVPDDKCYGLITFGRRRMGKTYKGGCIILEPTSRNEHFVAGIQSKTNPDGRKVFSKAVITAWRKLPFYFSPQFDNSTWPRKELRFYAPTQSGESAQILDMESIYELESFIDVRASVEEAYDGDKLHRYLRDEPGKCHTKDTPIRMHDGSIKMVQDVNKGDLLMGDDSKPRRVLSLGCGKEQCYDIVPKKGMTWGCNESHILSLKICNPSGSYASEKDIINLSVTEYLKLSPSIKKMLVLYRTKGILHSSFEVVPRKVEDYYGFTIDGNHLYCLGDYTVTHNTVEADVYEGWQMTKPCFEINAGEIIGKAILTTTVEEMERKGGENFKKLWDESTRDVNDKNFPPNELGQTVSGLYRNFLPAYDGYITDEYGNSLIEQSQERLSKIRRALIGKPGLSDHKRKYPWTIREAFRAGMGTCSFPNQQEIIELRLEDFAFGNKWVTRGNFENKEVGNYDTPVVWRPTPNGRFLATYIPPQEFANSIEQLPSGLIVPGNRDKGIAGADPFKYDFTKSKKPSNGAGYAYWFFDPSVDTYEIPEEDWVTDDFIVEYIFRPKTKALYGWDMINMCRYLGIPMFPEFNVPFLGDFFIDKGYKGYLLYQKDGKKKAVNPGGQTQGDKMKDPMFTAVEYYLETHGHRCKFDNFLQDCFDVDYDNLNPFDAFVAGAYTLVGRKVPIAKSVKKPTVQKFFKEYLYE